jgi:hypothetical protein
MNNRNIPWEFAKSIRLAIVIALIVPFVIFAIKAFKKQPLARYSTKINELAEQQSP